MSDTIMVEKVHSIWFGKLDAEGLADDSHRSQWFKKDPEFDTMLRDQFLSVYNDIVNNTQESWLQTIRGTIAYVIVLDQFSRNMFRDSPKMYEADDRAQRVSRAFIDDQKDRKLAADERCFLYMPMMHAEDLDVQNMGVTQFEKLAEQCPERARERFSSTVRYAEAHRDIIEKFQRFPHRNVILGRESTAEEIAFLQQPGSSF